MNIDTFWDAYERIRAMNIDIQNIGRYRLTSHGGRSYDLFNREDDLVYTITADEYSYIMRGNGAHHREAKCEIIEQSYLAKVGKWGR